MNLLRTRIRGLGPFADASLDLEALPEDARVVAVVGANGAGKSTALELALLGAPYRTLPTRGRLVELATERGASVESELVIGERRVRFRQVVDPVTGGGEAYITDATTGEALTSSSKVTEADAWVRAHLPSLDVVTASLFAAQASQGLLEMRPAERKRLLLRVHGIERVEALASRAGERARAARASRAEAQARRDEAARSLVEVSEDELASAERAAADARAALAIAEGVRIAARSTLEDARARNVAMRAHEEALDRARRDHAQARGVVQGIEVKLANNRALLADEARIREAHAALSAAREALAAREHDARNAEQAHALAEAACIRTFAGLRNAEQRLRDARSARDLADKRHARHEEAERHMPALDRASQDLRAAEDAHDAAVRALADLQAAQAGRSASRIVELRHGLAIYGDADGVISPRFARSTLESDDAQAAREASYPADLAAAQHAERAARATVARAREAHLALVRLTEGADPASREALRVAIERVEEAEAELRTESQRVEAARDVETETSSAFLAAKRLLDEARVRSDECVRALRGTPTDALVRLDQARARIEELEAQLAPAIASCEAAEALEAQLTASRPPEANLDLALLDVERAEAEVRRCTDDERRVSRAHEAMRARAEDAHRRRARLSELDAELAAADRELSRWSRLAADLGKDGVQAHLVDAAGPALSALVNELLHTCVSTRWTVTIATTRLTAKGEDREALELRVMDAESGREGAIETFSGGERVLLGEAISLALSVVACRTAGVTAPCLVRDESGAALDAEKGRAFVSMLRRAAGMVSASRILLVSHSREVAAECDAAIRVRDGAIEVVSVEEAA